jgi:predicted HAD superfamily Cof-like phosphohydrolase
MWDMQVDLIKEESAEFVEAAGECFADPENTDRRTELVKELSDLVFVCYQFAAAFNLDLDKAMTLVFESNMSKLDEQGKPIFRPDGKVLKGPNYQPPDLASCVPAVHFGVYETNGK